MEWFQQLINYGIVQDLKEDDPDLQVVPVLVEKIVVPKFSLLVEFVWDPLSAVQQQRVMNTVRQLLDYPTMGSDSEQTKLLFAAVIARLNRAITEDMLLPTSFQQTKEFIDLLTHQLSLGLKLLRCIIAWEGLLTSSAVQNLALTLICKKLSPALANYTPTAAFTLCVQV